MRLSHPRPCQLCCSRRWRATRINGFVSTNGWVDCRHRQRSSRALMRTGEMGIGRLAPLPLKAETLRNRFVEQSTQPPRVKAVDTWQSHDPSQKQPPALALDESVSQSPAPPPLHPPPPLLLPYPLRQSPIRMPPTPLSSYLPSIPFQSFPDLRQQLAANTSAMSWLLSKPNSNQLHNGP